MAWFSTINSERESALEKALQGMCITPQSIFGYDGALGKTEESLSQVYLLPTDIDGEKVVRGFFRVDGKLQEACFGFAHKKTFFSKDYFYFGAEGQLLKQEKPSQDVIYFPLQLTSFVESIGNYKDGKFVPDEGSPFKILGIDGHQGLHPLIFATETENGLVLKGIYKCKDGSIAAYSHKNFKTSSKEINDLVLTFKQGIKLTSKSPEKTLEQAAQQNSTGTSLPNKPLETKQDQEIHWEQPKSIVQYLDQFVVGQKDAKMVVAVAFSNYMTRVKTKNEDLPKDNILLIGPSGVGKTYMISLLAQKATLPMVQAKLTGKTSEGYKGQNLSTAFSELRTMTQDDAPYAVIFFDEIDKLANDHFNSGGGFGTSLQDELIGWLEEATITPDQKTDQDKGKKTLNTKNVLFVTAGAFRGAGHGTTLDDVVSTRIGEGQKQMGFATKQEEIPKDKPYVLGKTRPEDLIAYGLKPELVGRLPAIGILNPLITEEKVKILTEAKRSPLTKYVQLLELKGHKVKLEPTVPEIMVSYCPAETGARAINAICNDLFTEILYEPEKYADKDKIIKITPELARQLINLYG